MQVSPAQQMAVWRLGRGRGWSVRTLARLFRLDRSTVSRILRSRRPPPVPTVDILRRCPDCGALAVWPCRACQLRRQLGRTL